LKLSKLRDLSKGNYKAFLYDCDGTLADNMGAHKETYVKVIADSEVTISPEIIDEFADLPIVDVVKEINKRYKSNFHPEDFEARKTALFYNEFIDKTSPVQFVVDHLKASAKTQ
jgi:beta-phosphoglucomutase-like phosphatase (HAD superfamily)